MPDGVQRADGTGNQVVSLRAVNKRHGLVQVLNGIDLDLPGGQVTVLLGPPGAGKSTLCRAVGGTERIDSGSITVTGEPPRRRHRLPVAEPDSLIAHRTVLQNVASAGPRRRTRLWRPGRADGGLRASALLERVGAGAYAAYFPCELSDELRQRVAIARALAAAPAVLLVDRPTALAGALPAQAAPPPEEEVPPHPALPAPPPLPALLRSLAADGLAVLVATGDPAFARATADRVVFMEGGRIIEQGAPEDFFTTPRTARARAFLSTAAQH